MFVSAGSAWSQQRLQELARDVVRLVERHGLDERRQPLVVVEPETVELRVHAATRDNLAHFHAAHPEREAARLFAKVLGQVEVHGLAHVVTTVASALTTGTPILLALTAPAVSPIRVDLPPALRDLDVPSGCAADYDGWLTEATL